MSECTFEYIVLASVLWVAGVHVFNFVKACDLRLSVIAVLSAIFAVLSVVIFVRVILLGLYR